MPDWLALGAAGLSGLLGSAHCAAMCGGIAATATAHARPGTALASAWRVNLGRIAGYAVAGALAGGVGSGIVALARLETLQIGMRMAVGAVLVLAALRLFDGRGRMAFLAAPGQRLWRRLAPLQRPLLPADRAGKQFALGMLWGWLPCGLSATLLTAAWLSADPLQGALLMTAFGTGTLLTMLPLAYSGARGASWLRRPQARIAAGMLVLTAGVLTLAAPWLAQVPAMHALLAALGCRTLPA